MLQPKLQKNFLFRIFFPCILHHRIYTKENHEMMSEFAKSGKAATVVLPTDFRDSTSMFEQIITADQAGEGIKVPAVDPAE